MCQRNFAAQWASRLETVAHIRPRHPKRGPRRRDFYAVREYIAGIDLESMIQWEDRRADARRSLSVQAAAAVAAFSSGVHALRSRICCSRSHVVLVMGWVRDSKSCRREACGR